jgi:hypothetical protein
MNCATTKELDARFKKFMVEVYSGLKKPSSDQLFFLNHYYPGSKAIRRLINHSTPEFKNHHFLGDAIFFNKQHPKRIKDESDIEDSVLRQKLVLAREISERYYSSKISKKEFANLISSDPNTTDKIIQLDVKKISLEYLVRKSESLHRY